MIRISATTKSQWLWSLKKLRTRRSALAPATTSPRPEVEPGQAAPAAIPAAGTTPPRTTRSSGCASRPPLDSRSRLGWNAMPALDVSIRLATEADIPKLHALIESSVRGLEIRDYTAEQIAGALGTILGLDTRLVSDSTYFVAEARAACARLLVGSGGWSKRRTLFGSD